MEGHPLLALNLVSWNSQELPTALLTEVLEGAAQVGTECGYVTVGGHTVEDPEPKFGLAVVGEVHPDRLLSNKGLRVGDALVLTKRLGTGIIATAIKRGAAPDWATAAAVESMTTTNAVAARAALAGGAAGGTDITGFGVNGQLVTNGTAGLEQLILADAQTSGGLLFGVTPDRAPTVVEQIRAVGVPATVVGTVLSGTGHIHLRLARG